MSYKLLLPALLIIQSSSALVIRHDTPTLDYENHGKQSQFDAGTIIVRGNDTDYGIASATAIDSRWGVHARHTLRHVETWMDDGNTAKLRGRKWTGWNNQGLANVNVLEVIHFDDDFTRFANAIDIAVVRTTAASSARRIAPIYTSWDEVGKVGSGISGANNRQDGNGTSRKPENTATSNSGRPWEVLWGGKNDVNQVNTQSLGSPANALLKLDFDHPSDTSKSIMGGNLAIDLEYGSMNGDSGSPIYLEKNGLNGLVAGVLSGGSGNVYGSSVVYVRTRPYLNWITDTILAHPDNRTLTLQAIPDQLATVGEELTVTAVTSGSDQPPLTVSYRLIDPPAGASIDASSGVMTWSPAGFFSGTNQTITVEAFEDGIPGNSVQESFDVTVSGDDEIAFWNWSAAPPNWSRILASGTSNSYGQASGQFPYLQGNANNQLYQQITGTIPQWATVTVQIKLADFNQTWSKGGPVEYGLWTSQPTVATAGDPFTWSQVADVPNYDGDSLADGLGNTGGNVDYFFTFDTTTEVTNPWFSVRKNADGNRFGLDDIVISYHFEDNDADGLYNAQEVALGTDPDLDDTDGDGLKDGVDAHPLNADFDQDGWADGADVDPTNADLPGGPNPLSIGFSIVSGSGPGNGVMLPTNAYAGAPGVEQKNWNQTSVINGSSGNTSSVGSPTAGVLVDSEGDATGATVTYSMSNTWSVNNEDISPYGKLLSGYLDSNASKNATVTFTNIPYESYDVYVYVGSDVNGRTGRITDGTTTYSLTTRAKETVAGSYLQTTDTGTNYPDANYAIFEGKTGASLTLTYQREVGNAGIHAVQIVSTSIATAYETWASGHGLDHETDGLPTLDFDGDGFSNLAEFVLNSAPSSSSSIPQLTSQQDGGLFTLTYQTLKVADEATVVAKQSSDLQSWSATGVTVSEISSDDTTRTWKASIPLSSDQPGFLRLEITGP